MACAGLTVAGQLLNAATVILNGTIMFKFGPPSYPPLM